MGRRAKKSGDLGRSIQKAKQKKNKFKATTLHTTDMDDNRRNLQSVTEANDLDEFLNTAVLAGTDFVAEKQNVVVLDKNAYQVSVRAEPTEEEATAQVLNTHKLTVPRRPKWTEETSPEQLDAMEREDFLKWRRALVDVEKNENLILTPFEKNLEVWRQLWRVVERSDVVVQIIDSRNPLLFRSKDLEAYVKEVDPEKVNVLLLNKADLLSDYQRGEWAKYFNKNNINFIFFSARNEKIRLDSLKKETPLFNLNIDSDDENDYEEDDEDNDEDGEGNDEEEESNGQDKNKGETEEKVENNEIKEDNKEEKEEEIKEEKIEEEIANSIKILSGEELIENLLQYGGSVVGEGEKVTIGMVGYPNVGKSSTINVLCKQKKVAESATPGKTKHFQTIVLNESILLCDCPGLVFPSFVSTKADMVCNGLLPIDQMRDHIGPISILCQRIRRKDFKTKYGITLPRPGDHEDPTRPPTPWELLHSYGRMRGYMASHGSVDEPRSSRYLLKDYVSGKLLYCHPPQGISSLEFNTANVNVQYDDDVEEKPTSSNNLVNKTDNFDSIKAGLEEMSIIETKVPIKLYQGKRKLKRKHHGEGQESVVAKVKGKTPSSSFTRVQRSYNNASN